MRLELQNCSYQNTWLYSPKVLVMVFFMPMVTNLSLNFSSIMSFLDTIPIILLSFSASITGTISIPFLSIMSIISTMSVPCSMTMGFLVIMSFALRASISLLSLMARSMSIIVNMPMTFPSSSIIGIPLIARKINRVPISVTVAFSLAASISIDIIS